MLSKSGMKCGAGDKNDVLLLLLVLLLLVLVLLVVEVHTAELSYSAKGAAFCTISAQMLHGAVSRMTRSRLRTASIF